MLIEGEAVKGAANMNVMQGQMKNNINAQNTKAGMALTEMERTMEAAKKEDLTE